MIKELYDIVTEIQNTTGTNDKKEILLRECSNEEFKKLLKYVFDPMYIYGIQDKKLNKYKNKVNNIIAFQNLFECLDYLLIHNTGKDEDVKLTQAYIESEDPKYHDFLTKIITKKLKIGINSKSINKVYPKLIRSFGVMLAKNYYNEQYKIEGKSFTLTEKIDGMRMLTRIDNNSKVTFFSRQGQLIEGLIEIEQEISQLPSGFYDGELVISDYTQFKERDVLQETLKIARSKGVKRGLDYKVFDYITTDEFMSGNFTTTYKKRREMNPLQHVKLEHVELLPALYQGVDQSVIPDLLHKLESEGKEGLMLNLNDGIYKTDRSSSILKIKSMNEFDEIVTGIFEGTGKYEGMLGGVNLLYKGKYELSCGSGFTDEQRKYYWDNPEEIIGRVITVQYFRESKNQNGTLSVSFPVFRCVRELGKEPSYY